MRSAADLSEEDRALLRQFLDDLRRDELLSFMRTRQVEGRSGNKEDLLDNLFEAMDAGQVALRDLIGLLDEAEPWARQHVFLYEGPPLSIVRRWRKADEAHKVLAQAKLAKYVGKQVPLFLPEKLMLTSIEYQDGARLRVVAVEKRVSRERAQDHDEEETIGDEQIEYQAYRKRTTRGLIAFEWDLVENVAHVQVSQLPSGNNYDEAEARMANLLRDWVDLSQFSRVDIGRAIVRFEMDEQGGDASLRCHGIDYATTQGRRVIAKSKHKDQPLLGEEDVVDDALVNVRTRGGTGHSGNVYFLPTNQNPLEDDVHVYLVGGDRQRINFPTDNREEDVRHVLDRIRAAAK